MCKFILNIRLKWSIFDDRVVGLFYGFSVFLIMSRFGFSFEVIILGLCFIEFFFEIVGFCGFYLIDFIKMFVRRFLGLVT